MKHVFFDFDDTLVPATAVYPLAMQDVGLSQTSPAYNEARTTIKQRLVTGYPSARSRLLYFKEMALYDGRYSHAKLLELMEGYEDAVAQRMQRAWNDLRRADLMERLLGKGYRLSVVSNEMMRMQLKKLRLVDPDTKYFTSVTFSEEVGIEKPDLRIFRLALARAQARAVETTMVGDSMSMDIVSARKQGMAAILTTEFRPATEPVPASVPMVTDLNKILDRL